MTRALKPRKPVKEKKSRVDLQSTLDQLLEQGGFSQAVYKTFSSDDPGKYRPAFFYVEELEFDEESYLSRVTPSPEPGMVTGSPPENVVGAYAQIKDSPMGDEWEVVVKYGPAHLRKISKYRFLDFH